MQENTDGSKDESEGNQDSAMPPAEVIKKEFPGPGFRTVESTLETTKDLGMTEIVILGYDKDGDFVLKTSSMQRKDTLWLLQVAIKTTMEDQ